MSDPNIIRMIHAMRPQEAAAIEEQKQFFQWTEADIAKTLDPDNAEVKRLTSAPEISPEIARLLQIANEESPKT
ncbi:hypothetical protein [Microbacterium sp. NPDC079176]|uniref:hypothetical protein n=1 Tax=Microbacterium sp. NPDC079176 TaxID=3154768 RepID=UPI003418741B